MYVYYNLNPKRQQKQGQVYKRELEQTCISIIAYFEIEFQD